MIEATPLKAPLLLLFGPWNQPGARGLEDTPVFCAMGRYRPLSRWFPNR